MQSMNDVAEYTAKLFGQYERREALMRALRYYGYRVTHSNMSRLGKALAARKQYKRNQVDSRQLKLFK
jgi:hypothetical protein